MYHPDLIVLGYAWNDADLPNFIRMQIHAKSYAVLVLRYIVDEIKKDLSDQDKTQLIVDAPFHIDRGFYADAGEIPKEFQYLEGSSNFISSLKEISEFGKKNNIPVLLIADFDLLKNYPEVKDMGFYTLDMSTGINNYLANHGLDRLSIQLSAEDPHLNKLGHELYAQLLYEFIVSNSQLNNIFTKGTAN